MGRLRTSVLVAALLGSAPVWAQEREDQATLEERAKAAGEQFDLFTLCRPMNLIIEEVDKEATEFGLTRDAIQAAFESRLRAANLYDEDARESLHVAAGFLGPAMSLRVSYSKQMVDAFGESGTAVTWSRTSYGTHGNDAGATLNSLSQLLDPFLADHLRVNEMACSLRRIFQQIPDSDLITQAEWAMIRLENSAPEEWQAYWEAGVKFEEAAAAVQSKSPFEFADYKARTVWLGPLAYSIAHMLWDGVRDRPDGEPCAVNGPCR